MTIAQDTLTLDEFLRLPEAKPALEYCNGQVEQKVSPKAKHSVLQSKLVQAFNQFSVPGKLAYAFVELRTTFAGVSRVPDVSVYRWDRIALDASGEFNDDVRIPPDIAIEIVSPSQSVTRLVRRCIWFAEHGVRVALLVDPGDRSVVAFRPNAQPVALHGADRIDLDEVLPGFELAVDELFAALMLG